jgi:phospholipid/cholesterol/gamma-HCH transport system permease protein
MLYFVGVFVYAFALLLRSLRQLPFLGRQLGRCVDQCFHMGYKTVPIVGVLSLFIGAVLSLQAGYSLCQVPGLQSYLGSIVGLSMCRELGPVMTAFLLTGRVGSAIAAELGSMQVYQEIDALKMMNLPLERLLVMPRLLAGIVMMPFLTIFSIACGWIGGWVAVCTVHFITIDGSVYWRTLKEFVDVSSVGNGLIKAEVFGVAVILLCSSVGLKTRGGPREIGFSVTNAVVYSMMSILVLDYFVTRVLL